MSVPFDSEQLNVISHENGPALVLVGPGSGKTFTLTHHIKFLIERGLYKPGEILVLTFTKKASISMEERFRDLTNSGHVCFGTFHSIFYRLYIEFVKYQRIISPLEKAEILGKITPQDFSTEDLNNYISKKKSGLVESDFEFDKSLKDAFRIYNEILRDRGLLDYDDILLVFLKALRDNPRIVQVIKSRFKALLIDEFQDINHVQFEIIKLISDKNTHVFAVGDEDQSIYRFRGADPGIMKEFSFYYSPKIYYLNNNYRSKAGIINASRVLINKNQNRIKKTQNIKLSKKDFLYFNVRVLPDSESAHRDIKKELNNNKNKTAAILFRTNKDVKDYEASFFTGTSNVFITIAEAVEAYIDFSLTGKRISLFKILDCPDRKGLLRSIFKDEYVDFNLLIRESMGKRYVNDLNILKMQIDSINKMLPETALIFLKKIVKLEDYYIRILGGDKKKEIEDSFERLRLLSVNLKSLNDFKDCLSDVLKGKTMYDNDFKNLKIMTYHAAKGLEFDYVFLPDIVEGKVPSLASLSDEAIEEERRLFYVAMTRAKEKLFIYTIKNEESISKMPSRFLDDLMI